MTTTIWSYKNNFDHLANISAQDDFYVPLDDVRGDDSPQSLVLGEFNLDSKGNLRQGLFAQPQTRVLFGGHVGCGKSTELRKLGGLLSKHYTVEHVVLTDVLDINNLRFSDLLIALTSRLLERLDDLKLTPNPIFVNPLRDWFDVRIIKQEQFRDLSMEIGAEAKAETGLPFLLKLMAVMSSKFKSGASYREELRREVQNGFTQLKDHFNSLLSHASDLLKTDDRGPMLFIVDESEKLKHEDAQLFFNYDLNQLAQLKCNMLVCAPISILLEEGAAGSRFGSMQHLPMVKIYDREENPLPTAVDRLVQLVKKRLPSCYFDSVDTVKYLVEQSGGHPRDLINLVRYCYACLPDNAEHVTRTVAEKACRKRAFEYERRVGQDDWGDLVKIDLSFGNDKQRNDRRLGMLYDLVLLEYNNYWWRSHPLVRLLPVYQQHKQAALKNQTASTNTASTDDLA